MTPLMNIVVVCQLITIILAKPSQNNELISKSNLVTSGNDDTIRNEKQNERNDWHKIAEAFKSSSLRIDSPPFSKKISNTGTTRNLDVQPGRAIYEGPIPEIDVDPLQTSESKRTRRQQLQVSRLQPISTSFSSFNRQQQPRRRHNQGNTFGLFRQQLLQQQRSQQLLPIGQPVGLQFSIERSSEERGNDFNFITSNPQRFLQQQRVGNQGTFSGRPLIQTTQNSFLPSVVHRARLIHRTEDLPVTSLGQPFIRQQQQQQQLTQNNAIRPQSNQQFRQQINNQNNNGQFLTTNQQQTRPRITSNLPQSQSQSNIRSQGPHSFQISTSPSQFNQGTVGRPLQTNNRGLLGNPQSSFGRPLQNNQPTQTSQQGQRFSTQNNQQVLRQPQNQQSFTSQPQAQRQQIFTPSLGQAQIQRNQQQNSGIFGRPLPTGSQNAGAPQRQIFQLNSNGNDQRLQTISSSTSGRPLPLPQNSNQQPQNNQLVQSNQQFNRPQNQLTNQNLGNSFREVGRPLPISTNQLSQSNQQFNQPQNLLTNQNLGNSFREVGRPLPISTNQQLQINQPPQSNRQFNQPQTGANNRPQNQGTNQNFGNSFREVGRPLPISTNQQSQTNQQRQSNQFLQSNRQFNRPQTRVTNQNFGNSFREVGRPLPISTNQQSQTNQQRQNNQFLQSNRQFSRPQTGVTNQNLRNSFREVGRPLPVSNNQQIQSNQLFSRPQTQLTNQNLRNSFGNAGRPLPISVTPQNVQFQNQNTQRLPSSPQVRSGPSTQQRPSNFRPSAPVQQFGRPLPTGVLRQASSGFINRGNQQSLLSQNLQNLQRQSQSRFQANQFLGGRPLSQANAQNQVASQLRGNQFFIRQSIETDSRELQAFGTPIQSQNQFRSGQLNAPATSGGFIVIPDSPERFSNELFDSPELQSKEIDSFEILSQDALTPSFETVSFELASRERPSIELDVTDEIFD